MTNEDYFGWLSAAKMFVTEWKNPVVMPRMDAAIVKDWQSSDEAERLVVLAWSDNAYQRAWAPRIHDCIGEAIGADRGAWAYQLPFYSNIYADFFHPPVGRFILNAIIVTPSRVPMRLWPDGRPRVSESPLCPPGQPLAQLQQKRVALAGMSTEFAVDFEDVIWADRALRRNANLKVATTRVRRCYHPWHATVRRLFLADFDDLDDILAMTRCDPPACRYHAVTGKIPGRVGMAKIQLHRVNEHRYMDVLQLQTSHASGLLVDMRWSHQPFESLMLSEPCQGLSLRETIGFNQKLIRT